MTIHYLTVSVAQQSKWGLAECFWLKTFREITVSNWPELWSQLKAWLGMIRFQTHSHGWWRDSVTGRLSDRWFQFFTRFAPSLLYLVALSIGKLITWQLASLKSKGLRDREWEQVSKIEVTIFLQSNLGSGIPLLLLFFIVRSESLGLAYTFQVRGFYKRMHSRGRNNEGLGILEVASLWFNPLCRKIWPVLEVCNLMVLRICLESAPGLWVSQSQGVFLSPLHPRHHLRAWPTVGVHVFNLFNTYLSTTYYVSCLVVGAGDVAVTMVNGGFRSHGTYILVVEDRQ